MVIQFEIKKLFGKTFALGLASANGSKCLIDWGDGKKRTVIGRGKARRIAHRYNEFPDKTEYSVRITSDADVVTGLFLRYAAPIADIPPVRLKSFDVSQCPSLEKLALPQFSGLPSIDVCNNPKLRNLSCECHSFRSIDLRHNPRIEYLYLSHCRDLEALDLSMCPSLKLLDITGTYSLKELKTARRLRLDKLKISPPERSQTDTSALQAASKCVEVF